MPTFFKKLSNLSALSQSITRCQERSGSRLIDEEIKCLLDEIIQGDENIFSLPSGKSILVELASISPLLACYWLDLRGQDAWLPTRKSPYPLADLTDLLNVDYPDENHRTLKDFLMENSDRGNDLRALFLCGMRCAMPLTVEQASSSIVPQPAAFLAQSSVVHGIVSLIKDQSKPNCFSDFSLWNAFKKEHGALVFSEGMEPLSVNFSNKLWSPIDHAWKIDSSTFDLSSGPWWNLWAKDVQFVSEIEHLLPWLDSHSLNTDSLKVKKVGIEARNIVFSASSEKDRWNDLFTLFSTNNAWSFENNGNLLWQNILTLDTRLHSMVFNKQPPVGLSQKGSSGLGFWDNVSPCSVGIPENLVKKFLKICPLETKNPFLLRKNTEWTKGGDCLARLTLSSMPDLWLGSKNSAQSRWAIKLFSAACYEEHEGDPSGLYLISHAHQTLNLLLENPGCHHFLGSVAKGVLWTFQEMVKEGHLTPESPLSGSIVLPDNALVWSKTIARGMKLDGKGSSVHTATMAAVRSNLLGHSLSSSAQLGIGLSVFKM